MDLADVKPLKKQLEESDEQCIPISCLVVNGSSWSITSLVGKGCDRIKNKEFRCKSKRQILTISFTGMICSAFGHFRLTTYHEVRKQHLQGNVGIDHSGTFTS